MATVKGKWVLNEVISWSSSFEQVVSYTTPHVGYLSSGAILNGTYYASKKIFVLTAYSGADYTGSSSIWHTSSGYANKPDYFDFGDTEQEVSDSFYNFLTANATQQASATPAEITYNGATTSIEAGQTATLSCAGKKAVSDIVISFGSAGTITYNGTETAVEAGQTATMECAGKKMVSDVYINVVAPDIEIVDVAELVGTWTLLKNNLDFSMLTNGVQYRVTFTYGTSNSQRVAFRCNSSAVMGVWNSGGSESNLYYSGAWSTYSTNAHIWHITEVNETDPVKLLAIKQFLETNGTKS